MNKRTIKVMAGQDLPDIVIQELGTMELAMRVAADNGMALTATLSPGDVVAIDEELRAEGRIADELRLKGAVPATAVPAADKSIIGGGINFMGIEIDFMVHGGGVGEMGIEIDFMVYGGGIDHMAVEIDFSVSDP